MSVAVNREAEEPDTRSRIRRLHIKQLECLYTVICEVSQHNRSVYAKVIRFAETKGLVLFFGATLLDLERSHGEDAANLPRPL